MRLLAVSIVTSGCLILLAANNQPATLELTLVDAATGKPTPGVVRVLGEDGAVSLTGTLQRGVGLGGRLGDGTLLNQWNVVVATTRAQLPAGSYQIEAFSGVETKLARQEIELRAGSATSVTLPLEPFSHVGERGWRSANTHLHMMKIDQETADRYLVEIPAADDLDVLFVSYLERIEEDKTYISNRYPIGDLKQFSRGRVLVNNGEEHRHNMEGFGEGYGHVMLLDIRELVKPVSIGPGIMKRGHDGIPIQPGIENAHDQGGRAIWCHNDWGLEDIPNWITGRLDAQNIFDGGSHGSYKNSFYRYLNIGLRVPFSTGTDWFMYDLSRVYSRTTGSLTPTAWLDALSEGRSFITNGPLLALTVEGQEIGETLELSAGRQVRVEASARGRIDFGRLEVVRNGEVVGTASTRDLGGSFESRLETLVDFSKPGWLAARTPPPPPADDEEAKAAHPKNEFGRFVFGHTSPVYVTVAGRSAFDGEEAERLLADMYSAKKSIAEQGQFPDSQGKQRVLAVYDDGIKELRRRIEQHR